MKRCGTPFDSGTGTGVEPGGETGARAGPENVSDACTPTLAGSRADTAPRFTGIAVLAPRVDALLDPDPLVRLYIDAGPDGAEDAVCRAVEDLIHRLRQAERAHRTCDFARLAAQAHAIVDIAVRLGAAELAASAGHVSTCASRSDAVALGATLGRMLRIGQQTLTEVARRGWPVA